ncbi:unnamed protein product [Auanema sp. JU1783]|nr:unnamed protein product [Auanema sp. JU1783]
MTDYMAQMLNELMGSQRNALPGEQAAIDYTSPDVCRDFLVAFCLNESFRNTKNDIGFCPFPIHDEGLKKRYRESKKFGRLGYEEKFLERCRRMHNDVLRKIEKNQARLLVTQGDQHASANPIEKKRQEIIEQRDLLGRKIEKLMEEAQIEGERGNVAAAQSAVQKADDLTLERIQLDQEEEKLAEEAKRMFAFEDQVTAGNKQMQVCAVCGCFMLTNDAQSRIDDHLSGKLHIAYLKIRKYLDEHDKPKPKVEEVRERDKNYERPERPERTERPDRPDRTERPDRPERQDRQDRHIRDNRDNRDRKRSRSRERRDRRDDRRDHRDEKHRRDYRKDSYRRDRSRSKDRARR